MKNISIRLVSDIHEKQIPYKLNLNEFVFLPVVFVLFFIKFLFGSKRERERDVILCQTVAVNVSVVFLFSVDHCEKRKNKTKIKYQPKQLNILKFKISKFGN